MEGQFNLYDHAKAFAPDGKLTEVVKILDQNNPILHDAVTIESNSDNGHHFAVQNGLSEVEWRKAYEGVKVTKGSITMVHRGYGRASCVSEVDVAVAEKGGKVAEVRAMMAREHLDRMAEEQANKILYGSLQENESTFTGLADTYGVLSGAPIAKNVVSNAASTTDVAKYSSIYLVGWGKGKIFTFFPKGTQAGIKIYDYSKNGPTPLIDPENGGTFPGYKEQFEMLMGLCVQDWRYGARVCNIDVEDLRTNDADGAKKVKLYEDFMAALGKIKNLNNVKLICYASREVKDLLRLGYMKCGGVPQVMQMNNLTSSGNQGYGANDLIIDGIHIKAEDAVKETELPVK